MGEIKWGEEKEERGGGGERLRHREVVKVRRA